MMPVTSGGMLVQEPPESNCNSMPLALACPEQDAPLRVQRRELSPGRFPVAAERGVALP